VRAVAPPPPAPWLFLPAHETAELIHLRRPTAPAAAAGLARFPAAWAEIPQSRIQSALQTFISYSRIGLRQANYLCAAFPDTEPTARAIDRVSLDDCRVSVFPSGIGYEARWSSGGLWHQVTGGPADLGGFMELVLALGLR
jgi:hypothetical protein